MEIFARGVRIVREVKAVGNTIRGERQEITSFTPGSRRRLQWAAANAVPALVSQFGMTWHKRNPSGREVKAALNLFLNQVRKRYPSCGYLWILEFQARGIPHLHLFLTLDHATQGLQGFLAATWHRIAEPESPEHEMFHQRARNFIPWEMGDGGYLCKYLSKWAQKLVPANFEGVGRFWGASRLLVPQPVELLVDGIPEAASVVRTVCRHHESNNRASRWKHQARRTPTSYRLKDSAAAAWRVLGDVGIRPPLPSESQRVDEEND